VFDKDQNWRKQLYADYKKKLLEDDGTEDVGRAHFYNIMAKVKALLSSRGIITSDVSTLEGDDLLWTWATNFEHSQSHTKNVIVTADRDSVQIASDKTVIYNNNSKTLRLYSTTETKVLSKKKDIELVIVEPNEYLFKKILLGDKGDNIPNVVHGLGEKKVDSITQLVKELGLLDNTFSNTDYTQKIAIIINSCFNNKKSEHEIEQNLYRNAKLIQFHEHNIPEHLLEQAKNEFTEKEHSFNFKGELNLGNILKPETV
jgi:5'-3' exonuclease